MGGATTEAHRPVNSIFLFSSPRAPSPFVFALTHLNPHTLVFSIFHSFEGGPIHHAQTPVCSNAYTGSSETEIYMYSTPILDLFTCRRHLPLPKPPIQCLVVQVASRRQARHQHRCSDCSVRHAIPIVQPKATAWLIRYRQSITTCTQSSIQYRTTAERSAATPECTMARDG